MEKPLIKTILIDDEENERNALKKKLDLYCNNVEIIAEGSSVETGIQIIEEYKPDLVLLDIKLTDGTGFDILKHFSKIDFKIIFTTGHDEYALEAFQFSALDYLLKPTKPEALIKAIDKAASILDLENMNNQVQILYENFKHSDKKGKRIVLNTVEHMYIIEVNDIIRCESDRNYTVFHIQNRGKLLVSKTLKEYDELLSPYGFFRTHKSHLVNISYIHTFKKADGGSLQLNDGSEIPVSVRKKEKLIKLFESL